jgi:predicted Zn finger-like uncharacterized protein
MTMVSCPACSTVFRVSQEQLAARAGLVRCGRCLTVFNARDRTVQEPVPTRDYVPAPSVGIASSPSSAGTGVAAPGPAHDVAAVHPDGQKPSLNSGTASWASGAIAEKPSRSGQPAVPLPGILLAKESVDSTPPTGDQARPAQVSLELSGVKQDQAVRRRPYAWGTLVAAGAILAVLQLTYLFRSEMAQASSAMRPMLERFCAGIDCRIELPRQADLIHIDSSDLQPVSEGKGRLLLTATVKNRASVVQSFPYLELALTNARNQALARRVIAPEVYLPAEFNPDDGFAPHGEMSLRLVIDSTGVDAMGYQLYLFYP